MGIYTLFNETLQNPGDFWTALGAIGQAWEALIVSLTAVIVIFQLRQIRRERIENRVQGLKLAVDYLSNETFVRATEGALKETQIHGINWRTLLNQLNFVSTLVEQKYTDKDLLLGIKGHELSAIRKYLRDHPIADDISAELNTTYRKAKNLLDEAEKWSLHNQE
jgi:hypothetical protein